MNIGIIIAIGIYNRVIAGESILRHASRVDNRILCISIIVTTVAVIFNRVLCGNNSNGKVTKRLSLTFCCSGIHYTNQIEIIGTCIACQMAFILTYIYSLLRAVGIFICDVKCDGVIQSLVLVCNVHSKLELIFQCEVSGVLYLKFLRRECNARFPQNVRTSGFVNKFDGVIFKFRTI